MDSAPGAAGRIGRRRRLDGAAGPEPAAARHSRHGLRRAAVRHRGVGSRLRRDGHGAQHLRRGVLSARRRPRGSGAERAPWIGNRAGAGAGGDRGRAGRVVAPPGRSSVHCRAALRRRLHATAANRRRQCRRPPAGLSQLGRSAPPLLALCRCRICLRDRRNPERQLGHALSQRRAGRIDARGLIRARRLLGDGNGGTRAHRSDLPASCRRAGSTWRSLPCC